MDGTGATAQMSGISRAVLVEVREETKGAKQYAETAKQYAVDALNNEAATRVRVEALERWAATFSNMSLWRRLRWLIRGK
jgi:hypothetical protein